MRTIFIVAFFGAGCVAYHGGSESGDGDDSTGGCESCQRPHDLDGELMVLVNARLTEAESGYWNNAALSEGGGYRGQDLYLYDPVRECDDGSTGCRIVPWGHLILDERLGSISVEDASLRKFTMADLAWHPDRGLWGISYDAKNDEWGLANLIVPAPELSDNEIAVDRWVLKPSTSANEPGTDPCYWQDSASGLAFVDDELLWGVRGLGGVGLPTNGMVFEVDLGVTEDGHCVYPNDVSQDPLYYACDVMCHEWAQFPAGVGVAGDLEADGDGDGLAVVRAEVETIQPRDRMQLYRFIEGGPDEMAEPQQTDVSHDGLPPGWEIEGMARIGDRLFAVNTQGMVYEVDEEGATIVEHDDLAPWLDGFPEGVKIRGATRVVID